MEASPPLEFPSDEIKLRPLDLLLFTGSDLANGFIKFIQKRSIARANQLLDHNREYTHVGIVVTSDILDHPNVKPGKFYVMESTMSGYYGNKVGNIDNMENTPSGFLGVQVRDFDLLKVKYQEDGESRIAVSPLKVHPFDNLIDKIAFKKKFTEEIYGELNGITYDANCFSLLSSICTCLRPLRDEAEMLLNSSEWLFCSELVALIYVKMGIFPPDVNPKNVVPMDFAGYELDLVGGIPPGKFNAPIPIKINARLASP